MFQHYWQPFINAINMHPRYKVRIGLALVIALSLFIAGCSGGQQAPNGYSCSNSHCYAIASWRGSNYRGYNTDIFTLELTCIVAQCASGGNETGFIDDEAWLVAGSCYCWVEAGYSTYSSNSTTTDYFWADDRPGLGYAEHDLGPIPQGDFHHDGIYVISPSSPNTFRVSIVNQNTNFLGFSTNNTMTVAGIDIGQELFGTAGAAAPVVTFPINGWYDANLNLQYETTDGTLLTNNPPFGKWFLTPSNSQLGGIFWTECCLPPG